jgi:hypothetical protein
LKTGWVGDKLRGAAEVQNIFLSYVKNGLEEGGVVKPKLPKRHLKNFEAPY